MTSSDSGEDFESADDDFDDDFTNHKTTVAEIKEPLVISNIMDEESLQKVESLTKTCPNKGERCDPLHSDKTVFVENKNKDLSTHTYFKTNISNELEHGMGLIVNPKINSGIVSDVNFHSRPTTSDLEVKPIIRPTVKINECIQLLQTEKLSPSVGLVEIDSIQIEEPGIENLKEGDGWDIEEEDGFKIPDTPVKPLDVLTEKPAKEQGSEHDSENLKLGLGDGWDIEEDDGLEIPVTLVQPSDASIEMQSSHDRKLTGNLHTEQEYDNQGWGGWGGWGVSSLLSTATGTVSTFSSQVTAGLSTVLETTVGAPDPETLATASVKNRADDDGVEENPTVEENPSSSYVGFGSIVSGVSFLGSTVINRGLDTLESLGKKTMEVLQEGDPGLMKKRAILFPKQDKPVLSQILREAKEKADHSDKEIEEKETARKAHFESLFDDFQGMVHLEALEMLSTQCSLKLQTQLQSQFGRELEDLQETLSQVQELCELPDDDDEAEALGHGEFSEQITKCIDGLKINISAAKIIQVNSGVIDRLSELQSAEGPASLVNQSAISSLAEFTAAAMECFHKSAELLLAKKLHNTADEAENYIQLTNHLCARVSAIANDFSQLLTKNHPISNSSLITNIFLEASNSSSYIKNACQLLLPILQVGAVSS